MTEYAMSAPETFRDLLGHCTSCYRMTVAEASRLAQLNELAATVSDLEKFVRSYGSIADSTLDTTNEILNRAFS